MEILTVYATTSDSLGMLYVVKGLEEVLHRRQRHLTMCLHVSFSD